MEQSFFKKTGVIAFLILLLVIPLRMILSIIQERSYRNDMAHREIAATWGDAQQLFGPVLTIPYYDGDGNTGTAYFLPDSLNIRADLIPEKRYRGIFEVIVYRADISLEGLFPRPDFSRWGIADYQIDWGGAALTLGVSGLRGVQEVTAFQWNNSPVELRPGEGRDNGLFGLTGFIDAAGDPDAGAPDTLFKEKTPFRVSLSVHGSREMRFGPAAGTTGVTINSPWAHPSFKGLYLPSSRTIRPDGFNARWQISRFGRDYPGYWHSGNPDAGEYTRLLSGQGFGVELIQPVNFYTKSERSVKYGLLIICLTFLCFFMFEILNNLKIHPMQYLLVGFSLTVFYLLLISFSEHLGFLPAYVISSISCISLITWYAKYVLDKLAATLATGVILSGFFAMFYIVLQHEGYSLLIGSSSLFMTLAAVMWLTRKLDWYSVFEGTPWLKIRPLRFRQQRRSRSTESEPSGGGAK